MRSSTKCMQRTVLFRQRHRLGHGSAGGHLATRSKQAVQQRSPRSIAPSAAGGEAAGAAEAAAARGLSWGAELGSPRRAHNSASGQSRSRAITLRGRGRPPPPGGAGPRRTPRSMSRPKPFANERTLQAAQRKYRLFQSWGPCAGYLRPSLAAPGCPFEAQADELFTIQCRTAFLFICEY